LVSIRKEINTLKKTKADNEDVISLDERVNVLENKFEELMKERAVA